MLTITMPDWMVHRIVDILNKSGYTGAGEIIQTIKEQAEQKPAG